MSDIVEQLRQGSVNSDDYRWIAAEEITRLRAEIEDYKRWAAQVTVEANEKVSRLRAENERLREWNREIALNARELVAEIERLRAALREIEGHKYAEYGIRRIARAALDGQSAPGKEEA